jgi:hypothetical protein
LAAQHGGRSDGTLPEYVGFAQGFAATVIAMAVSSALEWSVRGWLILADGDMVAR